MYIYTCKIDEPAHGPQTMIKEHVVTGARVMCTCYSIGDLAFQFSEGTEGTCRLPLPIGKRLDSSMLCAGCRLHSSMLEIIQVFKVLTHVASFLYICLHV